MRDLNKVILSGRFGRDLELKTTQSGTSYTRFSLAVNTGFGENEKTHWIYCTAWGKLAETIVKYCSKGDKCTITGRLEINEYESKNEKKRVENVVVEEFFFGQKSSNSQGNSNNQNKQNNQYQQQRKTQQEQVQSYQPLDDDEFSYDDSVPF